MKRFTPVLGAAVLWSISHSTCAQDAAFEIGVRPIVLAGRGEPANDMLGGGIAGSWHWKDDWFFGVALDSVTFDYERPHQVLNIQQDPDLATIDGTNSFTRVAGWVERRYDRAGAWDWFWNAGLGFASVDAAAVVAGPTASGDTFSIVTDAASEVHFMAGIGLRRPLGEKWVLAPALHLEHHLTDYKITDTVSGATGTIGAQSPFSANITLSYRF